LTANLFLVGAPRSGTTSLYDYLARHPAVFAPVEKEPHRYDQDVLGSRRAMSDTDYRALYDPATRQRWLLDASALYLYSLQALDAVAGIADSHAIAVLRNPVELIASWHGLLVATGSEPHASLSDALAEAPSNLPFERRYVEIASFSSPVERWRDRLGAGRVHVLLFEELTGPRGDAVRAQLLRELGLDPLELGGFPHLNTHRRPAPVRIDQSRTVRRLARALLPAQVRRRLWWTATSALTPHAERPPMSPELRRRLELELDADVRRLEVLLDVDLRGLWFGSPGGQQPRS